MTDTTRLTTALADRYRLERQLGQGGMATVYLAQDLRHDRQVAIKVLRPELAAVLGAERFVVEIKTTAALQHPHILPLFDSGTADGFLYYVMPYIEGETLRTRLDREKQLGIDEAVRITREVADALDYAHRHGVIHRDIKPENILLHDGRPMVADFGIALAVSAAAGGRMTETGLSLGTPHYMSPEQATADRDITARSDIYSLASVLYEMLAGEPPHMGNSAQQIIMKIVTDTARPVTELRKAVPPNVAAAVAQALEKLPADRFESAKAFADALANAGFTSATMAVGPGSRVPVSRRGMLVLAALVPLVLAAGVVAGRRSATGGGPAAPIHASLRLGEGPVQPLGNLRLTISPVGDRIAYVGPDATGQALWVRDLASPRPHLVPGTSGAFAPFFSPDGESIGFFTGQSSAVQIKLVNLRGGAVRTLLSDSVVNFGGGAWGDDGNIYFTDVHLRLARVPAGGGPIQVVAYPDSASGVQELDFPRMIPGSRYALVQLWRGTAGTTRVGLVDLKSGKWTDLGQGPTGQYVEPGWIVIGTADGQLLSAPFDARSGQVTGPWVQRLNRVASEGANGTVQFAVSQNGTLVYQVADSTGVGLMWVSRDGATSVVDSSATIGRATVDLSPEGNRIALTRRDPTGNGDQVWVRNLATGTQLRISPPDLSPADRPVWTPDGRSVAFIATRNGLRTAWIRRADASDTARAVAPGVALDEIAFDPLGRYVLLRTEGTAPGTRHLLIMATGDTAPRPLIQSKADHYAMTISPNGRWLAYVSAESGTPEVYVRPFPDVDAARYVVSVGGGVEPVWTRDGKELLFRAQRGDVWSAQVVTQGRFESKAPTLVLSGSVYAFDGYHRGYTVSADGRRLLMLALGSGEGAQSLELILNWVHTLTGAGGPPE